VRRAVGGASACAGAAGAEDRQHQATCSVDARGWAGEVKAVMKIRQKRQEEMSPPYASQEPHTVAHGGLVISLVFLLIILLASCAKGPATVTESSAGGSPAVTESSAGESPAETAMPHVSRPNAKSSGGGSPNQSPPNQSPPDQSPPQAAGPSITVSGPAIGVPQIVPQKLDFGDVSIGTSKIYQFTVRNSANYAVNVAITLTGDGYGLTDDSCSEVMLDPSDMAGCTFGLAFNPQVAGESTGSLSVDLSLTCPDANLPPCSWTDEQVAHGITAKREVLPTGQIAYSWSQGLTEPAGRGI
jgi:hypothetical protein